MKSLIEKILLPAILIIAVCTLIFVAHWPALAAKAIAFDDQQYVTGNILVQNPSWNSAKRFLSEILKPSSVEGYYQPLSMISLMLDYSLGGSETNLAVFHRTSLIFHAANVALVIILLYLLFGSIWIAAFVGLLFGLHPMTVEPIPWLSERKTLLAAFFALWSLTFYVLHTRNNSKKVSVFCSLPSVLCLLTYLLALMSKPTSLPLPFMMLLMDYWPLNRFSRKTILEKIPLFVLTAAFAVIFIVSQSRTAGTSLPGQYGHHIQNSPLIIAHNIVFYLSKIFWPVNLTSHYPYPQPFDFSNTTLLIYIIAALILILILVLSRNWTKALLAGWLIFFIAILPTMQILKFSDVIASDKFAYLPAIGLLMILTAFLIWLQNKRSILIAVLISIPLLAVAETFTTWHYYTCWKDSITLYKYMISLAPNSAPLYGNLGNTYGRLGRYDEALEALNTAAKLQPNEPAAHYNLGVNYIKLGQYQRAIDAFKKTVELNPNYADAWNNLGYAYGIFHRYDDQVYACKKAAELKSDNFDAWLNLGSAYGNLGKFPQAVDAYARAVEINPKNPQSRFGLAVALHKSGEKDAAMQQYEILKTIDPVSAEKLQTLINQ